MNTVERHLDNHPLAHHRFIMPETQENTVLTAIEITAKAKNLAKVSAAGEPAANVIAILQSLNDGVKPTEELLRVGNPLFD
jgi:hypothetical protein